MDIAHHWPEQNAGPRSAARCSWRQRRLAASAPHNGGAVLIAFLAHVCLILAIVRLDLFSVPAAGSRGVAVPVVTSGPPPPNLSAAPEPTPEKGFAPDK